MPEIEKQPRYQVGDKVRIIGPGRLTGSVMRVQGTHSPDGHILYTVYVPMDPEPLTWLVREEEIEPA
jgi:hypothetical protein